MKAKKQATNQTVPVVVRLPRKTVVALDKVAHKNCRSRSSEIRSRIIKTLASEVMA